MPYHCTVNAAAYQVQLQAGFVKAVQIAQQSQIKQLAIIVMQNGSFDPTDFSGLEEYMKALKKNSHINLEDMSIHLITYERLKKLNRSGFQNGVGLFLFTDMACFDYACKNLQLSEIVFVPACSNDLKEYLKRHPKSTIF